MTHRIKPFPVARLAGYAVASLMAGLAGVGATSLTGVAWAQSPTTLGVAKNVSVKGTTDSVVVNARGITVYTLSGESARHLECTKANTCFEFWFPVTVNSARTKLSAPRAVKGKLGKLHRDGIFQVTLGGRPLYTFIGDGTKQRSATGEGIVSFGGTWHVVALKSSGPKTTPTSATTSTMPATSPTSPY